MKRLGILLMSLIILSVTAYLLYTKSKKNDKGVISADRDFTVKSMDEIHKLVIQHVKLQPLEFVRTGKTWLLNGKYEVDPAVFVNLEKALTGMTMLYIPPIASSETIKKSITTNGIKVTLYDDDNEVIKIFHVGTDTQKGDGTHMLLDGSAQPYVMQLPGLAGGLRSRFEQPEKNFRDKYLYKETPEKIDYIKVQYPKSEQASFIVENKKSEIILSPLKSQHAILDKAVNERILKSYLMKFERLGAEGLINEYENKNDVLALVPYCIIELKKTDGQIKKNVFYAYDDYVEKTLNSRGPEDMGKMNRLFVWSDDKDFYVVQTRVFGSIFIGYSDFYR
ncbi:MAG: hypothetical protein H7X99_07400 [Saprospiraceae bacterium]|nr:hypothetical protein [Saprospiraceae bacterium]